MDETTRLDAAGQSALSPEDERLLVKYADVVIAEEGAPIPRAAADLPILTCAAPPELVENIYRLQPEKRLIVATRTQMAADLAAVLSRSIKDNFFALYANETWYADATLEEIRSINSMLTDANGNVLRIQEELIPGIFASADGRLLAAEGYLTELGGTPLFGKQFHDVWGTLLPEDFTMETLADADLDFTIRTLAVVNLFNQMKQRADKKLPIPERTLIFGDGRALVTAWETAEDYDTAVSRVFFLLLFGAEPEDDVLAAMLPVLTDAKKIPEAFLFDLERIYISGAPCSFRKWNNILERLMLDYEELGIVKGGAAE